MLCKVGIHAGPIVKGLGGMGDGMLCLACGYESYDAWPPGTSLRATEVTQELWPAIEAARNLPGGINAIAKRPDPKFEIWLQQRGKFWKFTQRT